MAVASATNRSDPLAARDRIGYQTPRFDWATAIPAIVGQTTSAAPHRPGA
jgi:hypothetical protein